MTDIRVPKLNSNDDRYVLLEWLVEDGEAVAAERAVATVETSKAVEELTAGAAGRVWRLVAAGADCAPGEVIGTIADSAPRRERARPAAAPGVHITEPARALAVRLGVDLDRLRGLGRSVVRRTDVLALAGPPGDDDPTAAAAGPDHADLVLPRSQAGVAAAVSRAHATIPSAYLAVRVDVEEALAYGRAATRRLGVLVGLPEITLGCLGRLVEPFPLLFAAPAGDLALRRASGAHIAVTIDVGTGLFLPVVRDCDRRGIAGIAGALMELRLTAMRGRFADGDLAGATLLVSLGHDGVVVNQPIIPPGLVGAVSLTGVDLEPAVTPDTGAVCARRRTTVGLAYDHRYVNGSDAARFLTALRSTMESRADLDRLG